MPSRPTLFLPFNEFNMFNTSASVIGDKNMRLSSLSFKYYYTLYASTLRLSAGPDVSLVIMGWGLMLYLRVISGPEILFTGKGWAMRIFLLTGIGCARCIAWPLRRLLISS